MSCCARGRAAYAEFNYLNNCLVALRQCLTSIERHNECIPMFSPPVRAACAAGRFPLGRPQTSPQLTFLASRMPRRM